MPDESWETKQIGGLLKSFSDLAREVGSHETKLESLDRLDRELDLIRSTRRDDINMVTTMLKDIEFECDKKINSVHQDFLNLRKEIQEATKEAKKEAISHRRNVHFTRLQNIGLFIAACSPFLTVITLIVSGK